MECLNIVDHMRVLCAIGGFLGGTSMMLYMRPSSMADALRRIGVSVVLAIMLAEPAAEKVFTKVGSEALMGTSFVLGFIAWNILGAVAKFFETRQDEDIVQMVSAAKKGE